MVDKADLLKLYQKNGNKEVKWMIPKVKIASLICQESKPPENSKPTQHDPNTVYIAPNMKKEKGAKYEGYPHEHEERQKIYKPGPFALFYKLEKGDLDKQRQVWYYKDHKEIVGPVSSYNMDKMVFYRTIQEDTKVAFETIDKFVKFKKIQSILESENVEYE